MKDSLKPGLTFNFTFKIPDNKTVPALYPESPEFQLMPRVLATGYMVGLIEWACIRAVNPHLDWPKEQTVGTAVQFTHTAPTPPGLSVTVKGKLEHVKGRQLTFSIVAEDDVEEISSGIHERYVINAAKFGEKAKAKGLNTYAT
jgi:fluoroacetyl-CoA thioesterase